MDCILRINPGRVLRSGAGLETRSALKNFGCKEVKLTIYPDAGRDAWTQTYDDPELYTWFLKHRHATD